MASRKADRWNGKSLGAKAQVRLMDGYISLEKDANQRNELTFSATLNLYVTPAESSTVVFPFDLTEAAILLGPGVEVPATWISMRAGPRKGLDMGMLRRQWSDQPSISVKAGAETIEATPDDIVIRGAGKVVFSASCLLGSAPIDPALPIAFRIKLSETLTEATMSFTWASKPPSQGKDSSITWWLKRQ